MADATDSRPQSGPADQRDPPDQPGRPDQPDPRIELLQRALKLAGVAPELAGPLARKHCGRITLRADRVEVADAEGRPYDLPADADPTLRLAEEIKRALDESQRNPDHPGAEP